MRYYNVTLEINPKNISALNSIGLILMDQNKYQDALIQFKKAIEIAPNEIIPKLNFKLCLEQIERKNK